MWVGLDAVIVLRHGASDHDEFPASRKGIHASIESPKMTGKALQPPCRSIPESLSRALAWNGRVQMDHM